MASLKGHYASVELLESVKSSRAWAPPYERTALEVSEDGLTVVISGWHEALSIGPAGDVKEGEVCFTATGQDLRVDSSTQRELEQGQRFVKVAPGPLLTGGHGPYLKMLLHGCYTDQLHDHWCFYDAAVRHNKAPVKRVSLRLDTSELPPEGFTLQVEGEPLLWQFVPLAKERWALYKTTWASDEHYVPLASRKPWRVLSPSP